MNDKQNFLISELLMLSWGASVQRARLYRDGLDYLSNNALDFREKLTRFLKEDLIPQYVIGCPEEQHYLNIDALISYANTVDPGVLGTLGYKYGIAQKLLNLALKYHWCLGVVEEPPHCPIDRIIINKTKHKDKINWTQITERHQYQRIIEDIKVVANPNSIAKWELTAYSRR